MSLFHYSDDLLKKAKEESTKKEEIVTKAVYKQYSDFRNEVFKNLQELNPKYDTLTLFNKAQKLVQRFLFVFFAEAKSLFPTNFIAPKLETDLYKKYKLYFDFIFKNKKDKQHSIFPYTSGLFEADELLDSLIIDDNLLAAHIQKMSLYDFDNEVSITILGHIFEHSLNESEKIETQIKEKIEGKKKKKQTTKRKKEGVFYTPKYITKYIIEATIGKLCEYKKKELQLTDELLEKTYKIENKKSNQEIKSKIENYKNWLLQITICDPACGSGAFLNETLEFLISEHSYIYELESKLLEKAIIDTDIENKILENNIFGVDINEESVEIAKISLWLRIAQQGKKISTFNKNIKCGNSVIDDKEIDKEKAFDWQKEFPLVFEKGGFDVIIGNPPYVSFQSDSISKYSKLFYQNRYSTVFKVFDLFAVFIEKSNEILKPKSIFSFICPSPLLMNDSFSLLRKFITTNFSITEITLCSDKVFADAVVPTLIFNFTKGIATPVFTKITKVEEFDFIESHSIKHSFLQEKAEEGFNVNISLENSNLLDKLYFDSQKLGSLLEIRESIKTGNDKEFIVSKKINENYYPLVTGKEVSRYNLISDSNKFILFDETKLSRATKLDYYTQDKLFIRRVGNKIECVLDTQNYLSTHVLYIAFLKEEKDKEINLYFLISLLNSKLFSFVYSLKFPPKGKVFPEIRIGNLRSLPIKVISKENQQPFIDLAIKMLSLNEEFETKKSHFLSRLQDSFLLQNLPKKLSNFHKLTCNQFLKEVEKQKIKLSLSKKNEWQDYFEETKKEILIIHNQIQITDNQIDKLVFELYELSEEEIEIMNHN